MSTRKERQNKASPYFTPHCTSSRVIANLSTVRRATLKLREKLASEVTATISPERLENYRATFALLSSLDSIPGFVCRTAFRRLFKLLKINITEHQFQVIWRVVDTEDIGRIDFDQFLVLMSRHDHDRDHEFQQEAHEAFFELAHDGVISPFNLQNAMNQLGHLILFSEAEKIINLFDSSHTGMLHEKDFVKFLTFLHTGNLSKAELSGPSLRSSPPSPPALSHNFMAAEQDGAEGVHTAVPPEASSCVIS